MEKQIDICKSCCYSVKNYTSVIGTIPYCCEKHWHCKPGSLGIDYKPKAKKEKSENKAEYIERERLKRAISADCQHLFSFDESLYDLFMIDIDEFPAADVAPVVHGRWEDDVYTDPYGGKWTKYRCSLCGRIEVVKEPYCSCGAKMDLEESK